MSGKFGRGNFNNRDVWTHHERNNRFEGSTRKSYPQDPTRVSDKSVLQSALEECLP